MQNISFLKLFAALLFVATTESFTLPTAQETVTNNAVTIETKNDTVYPQFPGGIEALEKHLDEIKTFYKRVGYIIEIDEKGKASYIDYGSRYRYEAYESIKKIVNTLPHWTPGTLAGKPTRFAYIVFNDEKFHFECINAGCSDRHKLLKSWVLSRDESKGIATHPIYKEHNKWISIVINSRYQLLEFIGDNSNEYSCVVSDTANIFTIRYDNDTVINYCYTISEDGRKLTTYYTDESGNRQSLVWIHELRDIPAILSPMVYAEFVDLEGDVKIEMQVDYLGQFTMINEDFDSPEFPGGMGALMQYLKDNLNYPRISRVNHSQGKVYVNFVINTDGSICDVEIMKSTGDKNLDNEAIRIIKNMPKWIPGKVDGKAVRTSQSLILYNIEALSSPPPTAKQITEILEIVEDDAAEIEEEIIAAEIEEEFIYEVVQNWPEFPGGMKALMQYLKDNMNDSRISRENHFQGKAYVNFVVNTDGTLCDVEIYKSSGDKNLDNEAIRIVKNMPKWIPGKQSGKAVRVRFTLPVTFRLQ